MKKLLPSIIAAIFLVSPSLSFASYIIHLKDGRRFTTDRYWEEGDQIRFKRFGGEIGIPKSRVRAIEEVKENSEPKAPTGPERPARPQAPEPAQKMEPPKKGEEPGKANPPKPDPESGKEALIHQYRDVYDTLREKFKKAPMMGEEDLLQYVDELIAFKKGILSDRLADTFKKELQATYSMLDEVEEILRLKNH